MQMILALESESRKQRFISDHFSLANCKFTLVQVAANDVVITITGKREGIKQATFIMSKIVKSNLHKLNQNSMSLSYKDVKTAKPKKAGVTVE